MKPVTQQFKGITADQFEKLATAVKAQTGVTIDGNTGSDQAQGYTISWAFDPATGDLSITCSAAPFPASLFPNEIGERIAQMVNKTVQS